MKKTIFISILATAVTISGTAQNKPAAKAPAKATAQKTVLKNMADSASYAIGVSEAKFMKQQGLTKINSAMVAKAIEDVMNNKEVVLNDAQCNNAVMGYINKVQQEKSKDVIIAGEKFLQENKKKPGVKTTSTGLQYEVIKEGSGIRPTPEDSVTCHYAGSLINGNEFESSYKNGQPITFNLRGVIPGWTEGLQYMTVGSKYRFFIPYQLAYGTQGSGPIPGGSTLIFEVELLDVKKKNP
ncbi:MAG: FKBP-type peptidyl-prolyl cis-trans isomerase [Bacteroidota bacterium]